MKGWKDPWNEDNLNDTLYIGTDYYTIFVYINVSSIQCGSGMMRKKGGEEGEKRISLLNIIILIRESSFL